MGAFTLRKKKAIKSPDGTASRKKGPVNEALLKQRTRNLEKFLATGNFRKANEVSGGLFENIRCTDLPLENTWRAKATAISAGLYFYHGNTPAAHRQLNEYVMHEEIFLAIPGLRVGQKLVLAEYSYSRGEFETAIKMAEKILAGCEPDSDLSGIGEIYHFLSRCHRRLHQYDELRQCCDRARDCFHRHFLSSDSLKPAAMLRNMKILRWRIGLSCLIEGYSLWSRGNTGIARHRLITARSLLEGTGDYIDEANVLQSLGSITRSEGNYDASLESLLKALDLYNESGHHLNQARTLTNIGRTYLCRANPPLKDRDKAREMLDQALEICEKHSEPKQKAEALVIMSWLFFDEGNPTRAEGCASEALRLGRSVDSPGLQAEARRSIGYCRLQKNDESAIGELTAAVQHAKTLKLQISVHLALAEAYEGFNKLSDAVEHLREAQKLLDPKLNVTSIYLTQKCESVRKTIDGLQNDYFMVTFDSIRELAKKKSSPRGLTKATKDLERWAILKALEQSSGGMTKAAEMLGLARQAFWQRKKRARLK
jgi:tetratricopeptide (TPR) repeat protein